MKDSELFMWLFCAWVIGALVLMAIGSVAGTALGSFLVSGVLISGTLGGIYYYHHYMK